MGDVYWYISECLEFEYTTIFTSTIRKLLQSSSRVVLLFHLHRSTSELQSSFLTYLLLYTTSSQTLRGLYTHKTVQAIRITPGIKSQLFQKVVNSHKFQIPGFSVRQTVSISSYLEALTKPHNCVGKRCYSQVSSWGNRDAENWPLCIVLIMYLNMFDFKVLGKWQAWVVKRFWGGTWTIQAAQIKQQKWTCDTWSTRC